MKVSEVKTQEDFEIYRESMRMKMALIAIPVMSILFAMCISFAIYILITRHDYLSSAFLFFAAMAKVWILFPIYRYYWK